MKITGWTDWEDARYTDLYGMTSEEFATELIQKYNVAVVPGSCFGDAGEGFIRCCYATDINKIKVAMERIAQLVKEKTNK